MAGRKSASQLEEVTREVRRFYEACSFPGYDSHDTPSALADRARRSHYARLLDEQIPDSARVADVGCGTGQMAIFLSLGGRRTVGADLSSGSLRLGQEFKERFGLKDVRFVQMNLFEPALRPGAFDYVFSNGVLHHTADARTGFERIVSLVRPGGYVILGLYNRYGRLAHGVRRRLFRMSRRLAWLDHYVRTAPYGRDKAWIWYLDQYEHPHEDSFTVDDVLKWFAEAGVQYVSSVPRLVPGVVGLRDDEPLFEPAPLPGRFERLMCQAAWAITLAREGGFFITIGRRLE